MVLEVFQRHTCDYRRCVLPRYIYIRCALYNAYTTKSYLSKFSLRPIAFNLRSSLGSESVVFILSHLLMNRYLAHTVRFARAPKSAARCSLRHNSSNPPSKAQSSLHRRRELEYPLENGVGDFLTPKGLHTIAVEWQEGLLQRLNDEVKGESLGQLIREAR